MYPSVDHSLSDSRHGQDELKSDNKFVDDPNGTGNEQLFEGHEPRRKKPSAENGTREEPKKTSMSKAKDATTPKAKRTTMTKSDGSSATKLKERERRKSKKIPIAKPVYWSNEACSRAERS